MEGGIPQGTEERWDEYAVYTSPSRGPVNYYRTTIKDLGWQDVGIGSIVDDKGKLRQIDEWPGFVWDGIKRARQQTGRKLLRIGLMTKELRVESTRTPPESITLGWRKRNPWTLELFTRSWQMELGFLKGLRKEGRMVMELVSCVEHPRL
eukprot:15190347-Heterocapsa_arctica.AAC.1